MTKTSLRWLDWAREIQALAQLNGLLYPYLLKVGIRLRIPGRG